MTTRRFRATSDGAAFDVEVDADTVRVRYAAEAGGPSPSEASRDGAGRNDAAAAREFAVTSQNVDGLRIALRDTDAGPSGETSARGTPAARPRTGEGDSAATNDRALVATVGDRTWVWIDGEAWTIEVEPAERARRPRAPSGAEGLSAPMPATVIRILVEPGKDVRRGETLLLLEAMKMELPVRAPRDGRVTAIHCQAGELVQPGVTLVDLA